MLVSLRLVAESPEFSSQGEMSHPESWKQLARFGVALYRRGMFTFRRVHTAKREHTAAVQCYSKACELFPAFGMAHFALAGEFRRLGDQAQANQHLAAYSKNTTAEPPLDDPSFKRIYELNLGVQARLQRAAKLAKAGRLEEAIEESE